MGTNNRDRRRQKKRRQAAAARARERRRQAPWVESTLRSVIDADDIERMLAAAVCAHRDRDVDVVLRWRTAPSTTAAPVSSTLLLPGAFGETRRPASAPPTM